MTASELDEKDPLGKLRARFLFPKGPDGKDAIYLCGNSLGLQPKKTQSYVFSELEDWEKLAVEAHFHGRHPWLPYHELVTGSLSRLVGAKPEEVVAMNSLTVNLHLMMASFYRPTKERFKILVEGGAFPSDQYAVKSQAAFHGYDPKEAILELQPRAGEHGLRRDDILSTIDREGDRIALVMLGGVNYLTGQVFDGRGHEGCSQERLSRGFRSRACRWQSRAQAPRLGSRLRRLVLLQIPERRSRRDRRHVCSRAARSRRAAPEIFRLVGTRQGNPLPDGARFPSDSGCRGLAVEQSADFAAGVAPRLARGL
jgi:hypothetical protein